MNGIPTATLLIGYSHQDEREQNAFDLLAGRLAAQLDQPVIPCSLDEPGNPLLDAITTALRQGAVRIVALPLFLSPADFRGDDVAGAIAFASQRWPFIQFHLSPSPDGSDWVAVCRERLTLETAANGDPQQTAVILVGRGGTDADANSDVAKLAHLLLEATDFGWVDVAFVANTRPSITEVVERYRLIGAARIVVSPFLLFDGTVYERTQAETMAAGAQTTSSLSSSNLLIEILEARHAAALQDRSLLPISWEEVERQLAAELNTHDRVRPGQPAPDAADFQQLTDKIDAILPPRYQGQADSVSAAPMAAADLVFDETGAVAWDQVFGVDDPNNPFCELALAGGPSHRGELLEPGIALACEAESGKYAAVLAEIERGIELITGLPVVESKSPGWVGVQCDSDEMAIWLVRAIIVENVMVRREGDVLFLPAGPQFTLKNEIKSIVTVTAKTWHYWIEHITAQQLRKTAAVRGKLGDPVGS